MQENNDSPEKEMTPSIPENNEKEQLYEIIGNIKPPLTDNQKQQLYSYLCTYQSVSIRKMRSAPLPHPSEFEKYEKVLPGSADRILKMAENQSKHRQGIENKIVSSDCFVQNTGVIFAFIIALVIIVGSMFLIYIGKDVAGLISIIAVLVSLVGIFLTGKHQQQKQLQNKEKTIQ